MSRILVADDESSIRFVLRETLEGGGHEVLEAVDGAEARRLLADERIDFAFLDIRMPGASGLELLDELSARGTDSPVVVIMTAQNTFENAIEAMKRGAFDYVTKPFDLAQIEAVVAKALRQRELRSEVASLRRRVGDVFRAGEALIGFTQAMVETYKTIGRVAQTEAIVLIRGESGTGKELVARAIHYHSRRHEGAFVAVNMSALPSDLIEAELFGHEKGAFTGAINARAGRFRDARGGTLLLDEIGDLPPNLQAKLLRVLQEYEFEPVGSSRSERVDTRIVAATNQNLAELIRERRFRQDLYFRLSVVEIEVPPLRQRRDDISLLVEHFLHVQRRGHPDLEGISEGAMKRLTEYEWPGNVRELENLVERTALLRCEGWITEDDLPRHMVGPQPLVERFALPPDGVDFSAIVDDFENELIRQALDATGWNKKQAAELLGLKRTTLVEKIRAKKIEP